MVRVVPIKIQQSKYLTNYIDKKIKLAKLAMPMCFKLLQPKK